MTAKAGAYPNNPEALHALSLVLELEAIAGQLQADEVGI
jgi:hypothetical protein